MSRPPKPAMTEAEYEATKCHPCRAAAWVISEMRGAAQQRSRQVSHEWVVQQRKARQETPIVKKLSLLGRDAPLGRLSRNGESRDTPDPDPHLLEGSR